jgi:uncharacterized protein (TIGR02996 family)
MQQQPYGAEELSLIDAVHATPHDDAPRLAYADWLEAGGAGDYAEFIRLQCQKPYIGISNRDPTCPRKSVSWEFPWGDKAAEDRLARLLTLLPGIYRTERFAGLAQLKYYEEFFRGLSLREIEEGDYTLPCGVARHGKFDLPPLARARLSLHIDRFQLADWLNHPLMFRVDELRIWLHSRPDEPEFDDPEVHTPEFDVPEIQTLADWPLLKRLTTLHLCAPIHDDAVPLIAQLLEPCMVVDTSY